MSIELPPPILKRATKLVPINSRGEVLVGRRSSKERQRQHELDFVGGKRERTDCCTRGTGVREGFEEVGILFDHSQLHQISEDKSPSGKTLVTTFWLRVPDDITPYLGNGEFEEAMFIDGLQLYDQLAHPSQQEVLGKLLSIANCADLRLLPV